jgi:hypothetical protein
MARRLRRDERLTSLEIAQRLGLSRNTILTYIKGLPFSRRELSAVLKKRALERWDSRELRDNRAIKKRLARLGIVKCQFRGCRWHRTLELHHESDGTVKVLCPNHHSLTPDWKGRKNKGRKSR